MSHWVADYIGQPWVPGENDCWSFFRKIQANHFGRTVPIINVDALNRLSCVREFQSHTEYSMWYGIENPQDGDAVLLAKGKHPSHIGIWINDGVLHSVENFGVIWQSKPQLKLDGWQHLTFFRHV